MKFSATTIAIAFASASLPHLASAYIGAMSVDPDSTSVKPGGTISTTLTSSIYIQNWEDFGIVWGLRPVGSGFSCGAGGGGGGDDNDAQVCTGIKIDYTPIYKRMQEEMEPPGGGEFPVAVSVPRDQSPGDYELVAAVSYLVGASGLMGWKGLNDTVTIAGN